MKKIISLFQRNYNSDRLVRNEVVPGAEWILEGEGTPTRKFDGTCCMIKDNKFYKRYDVKKGRKIPDGFIPAQDIDSVTGHYPGWVLVGEGKKDKWHREAFSLHYSLSKILEEGTFELCGPKIQNNPEKFSYHVLIRHGRLILEHVPRNFEGIKNYLQNHKIEGIVWHHPDGRMVKIKGKDFGIKRNQ